MKQVLFITIILICSQVFGQQFYNKYSTTGRFLSNPERGASHSHIIHFLDKNINTSPAQLIWAYFYFPEEAKQNSLTPEYLNKVREYFNIVRKYGKKIIPRFAYTTTGTDAPMNMVETHIKQLAPILHENKEIILTIHAGFVGKWGEWHSSSNNLNTTQVLELLFQHFPSSVPISIRYPSIKMGLFGTTPLSAAEAVSFTSKKSRVSFHNDCFLKNSHDEGTYFDGSFKYKNEQIRAFLSKDSLYEIVGGELCGADNATIFACPNALKELAEYHWTYLNGGGEAAEWVKGGCSTEIRDRFGYQLFLRESRISHSLYVIGSNQPLNYTFKIENKGFAAPFYNRPLELVFTTSNLTFKIGLTRYPNLKTWLPGSVITISGSIPPTSIPAAMAGNIFSVSLRLPDASLKIRSNNAYSIGFVNDVYDPLTGLNNLNLILRVDSATVKSPAIQNLGCFKDDSSNRDLPVLWGTGYNRNTCFQKANSVGHTFFALQFGGQCYTGHSYGKYGKVDASACNLKCADGIEICGGFLLNTIYTAKSIVTKPFSQIGCFKDEAVRDLENHWGEGFEKNSCFNYAKTLGHKYFALQNGGNCYTGNSYGKYGSLDFGNCNIKCFADPLQICGGSFANLVGVVNTDVKPDQITDLGCYADKIEDRDLPKSWGNDFEKKSCYLKAKFAGHKYFSLQFGGECNTGNTFGKHGKLDSSKCQMTCKKDSTQICGGLFAQSIFTYSSSNVLEGTLIEESEE